MTKSAAAIIAALLALSLGARADEIGAVVFAFTGGDYDGHDTWDWDTITHLGFWTVPDDDVRSTANKHGVKLLRNAGTPDKGDWTDASKVAAFAEQMVQKVAKDKLDGVFFDYEGNGLADDEKAGYTLLAKAVADAIAPAVLVVCVGGRPSYELRNYDYSGLATAADFLFIMGYDLHLYDDYTCMKTSQGNVCSPAEASIRSLAAGVHEYLDVVPASKLVLGVPWYGQRYDQAAVPINEGQINYKDVLAAFDAGIVTKHVLDHDSYSWKIECKHQCLPGKRGKTVWFDDAETLAPKYALAASSGLRGVGMWKADDLPSPAEDGTDPHKSEREAMWAALRNYWTVSRNTCNNGR